MLASATRQWDAEKLTKSATKIWGQAAADATNAAMMVQKLATLAAAKDDGGKLVTQGAPPPQDLAVATVQGWGQLTMAWVDAAERWWNTIVEWAYDECAYTGVNQTAAVGGGRRRHAPAR